MKKNFVEGRTCEVILNELIASVDKFNKVTDEVEKAKLMMEQAVLAKDFNDTSMLTKYADCMKCGDEPGLKGAPVKALVIAKSYQTVTVQEKIVDDIVDGHKTRVRVRSIKSGLTPLNVQKFILWAEDKNKHVTASPDWFVKVAAARAEIQNAWKKFRASNAESVGISKKKMKQVLQDMFDSIVFIDAKGGKNAVIATGAIAADFFEFSNKISWDKSGKSISIRKDVLPNSVWDILLLNGLNEAVTGKVAEPSYDGKSTNAESEETEEASENK